MSIALIRVLIGVGFFLWLVGVLFGKTSLWVVGLLLLGAGFYMGLKPDGILRRAQVLETWALLIEDGQGKGEEIFQNTDSFIKESKAPSVGVDRQEMSPGIIRGIMGTKRQFLRVADQNSRFKPYQIFINARNYGDNLDVAWYLTYRPAFWQAILSLFPYLRVIPEALRDIDLFDQQDLRAFTTNVHHCLNKAVDKVLMALNQDPSKVDRKSRGFLGIS